MTPPFGSRRDLEVDTGWTLLCLKAPTANEGKAIVVDKFKYIHGYIDDNHMLAPLAVLVFSVCIITRLRRVLLTSVLKTNYDF